jgi:iron(III) transport system substrate-binding protein
MRYELTPSLSFWYLFETMNQYHFHSKAIRKILPSLLAAVACLAAPPVPPAQAEPDRLVVYSGRAERLIKPLLDSFQAKTGIHVDLLSSGTTEVVNRLQAEGERTPADLLITNDAGSLERARELGLLRPPTAPNNVEAIPAKFRAADNGWIGLSGRFWIVVYNTTLVKPADLRSLLDLAEPRWRDKIAIPNAGSEYLQAGVSVIQAVHGNDRTKRFLDGLKANAGTQVYGKSSQIVEAVAKGQVALGVVNHYYVYRYLATQPDAPIAVLMPDQQEGGMGAIINVSGAGIVAHAKHAESAKRLVDYLVSEEGQKQFADLNKEYPLHPRVTADPLLPPYKSTRVAPVPLTQLGKLREPAMALIEQAGLR